MSRLSATSRLATVSRFATMGGLATGPATRFAAVGFLRNRLFAVRHRYRDVGGSHEHSLALEGA